MTREEFTRHLTDLVRDYINYYIGSDEDPQIKINPVSLNTEFVPDSDKIRDIEFSDEAIEQAAAAEDAATEDATDYQASQNPDYYSVKSFVRIAADGTPKVDPKAIESVTGNYFK